VAPCGDSRRPSRPFRGQKSDERPGWGVPSAFAGKAVCSDYLLADAPVDIAVLDIDLNGTSVVPLAEHLRARGIPFVFLSGYCDEDLLPQHLRGRPRFDKPVEADRLVRAMLDLTRRPSS
jgi:two-component SAPR family response regulator